MQLLQEESTARAGSDAKREQEAVSAERMDELESQSKQIAALKTQLLELQEALAAARHKPSELSSPSTARPEDAGGTGTSEESKTSSSSQGIHRVSNEPEEQFFKNVMINWMKTDNIDEHLKMLPAAAALLSLS